MILPLFSLQHYPNLVFFKNHLDKLIFLKFSMANQGIVPRAKCRYGASTTASQFIRIAKQNIRLEILLSQRSHIGSGCEHSIVARIMYIITTATIMMIIISGAGRVGMPVFWRVCFTKSVKLAPTVRTARPQLTHTPARKRTKALENN